VEVTVVKYHGIGYFWKTTSRSKKGARTNTNGKRTEEGRHPAPTLVRQAVVRVALGAFHDSMSLVGCSAFSSHPTAFFIPEKWLNNMGHIEACHPPVHF
jgi:hypothetical protein